MLLECINSLIQPANANRYPLENLRMIHQQSQSPALHSIVEGLNRMQFQADTIFGLWDYLLYREVVDEIRQQGHPMFARGKSNFQINLVKFDLVKFFKGVKN